MADHTTKTVCDSLCRNLYHARLCCQRPCTKRKYVAQRPTKSTACLTKQWTPGRSATLSEAETSRSTFRWHATFQCDLNIVRSHLSRCLALRCDCHDGGKPGAISQSSPGICGPRLLAAGWPVAQAESRRSSNPDSNDPSAKSNRDQRHAFVSCFLRLLKLHNHAKDLRPHRITHLHHLHLRQPVDPLERCSQRRYNFRLGYAHHTI
mmetsp:Transcript_54647/g.146024  ORF Transcript_54647/g.146024 Transcript_54647/m.146024 type:complete len:207 (-) Transcript_54647:514-1134(-)